MGRWEIRLQVVHPMSIQFGSKRYGGATLRVAAAIRIYATQFLPNYIKGGCPA